MRIHPRLVEQERDSEHDEKESEIHKREAPSTTPVEAISELELPLLFQRRHSQIDQDRGAHHQETEVQKPVYQRQIRNGRYQLTRYEQVRDTRKDPDEGDTEPVAYQRAVHPEHREREQSDHDEGQDDQSQHVEGTSLHVHADDER